MLTSATKKEQKTLFGCMYEQYLSKKIVQEFVLDFS